MSLYNLLNGASPATFFLLPMLGKHPDQYPRFRDCFSTDKIIKVYTRTGGGNRAEYEEENQAMRNMPGFVDDYDDSFDSTYAYWTFMVPEMWQDDFEKIRKGELEDISNEYQHELRRVFPKLSDKFDELLGKEEK